MGAAFSTRVTRSSGYRDQSSVCKLYDISVWGNETSVTQKHMSFFLGLEGPEQSLHEAGLGVPATGELPLIRRAT